MHVYGVVCYTEVRRGRLKQKKKKNELALRRAEMRMISWMSAVKLKDMLSPLFFVLSI